jgi:hypothetical protein
VQDDLLRRLFSGQVSGIDGDFGVSRNFIRIRDAGELFENPGARFGVLAFAVALLADIH